MDTGLLYQPIHQNSVMVNLTCFHTNISIRFFFFQSTWEPLYSPVALHNDTKLLSFWQNCRASEGPTDLLLFHHFRQLSTHKGLGSSSAIKVHKSPCRKWRYKSIPLVFMLGGSLFRPSCLCALCAALRLQGSRCSIGVLETCNSQCQLTALHWAADQ